MPQSSQKSRTDSDRNTRWNRGPTNCTPTTRSPSVSVSPTCTTRPLVSKSCSLRRDIGPCCGMRISRFDPMATSNRVRNAAPPRHRFSLAVSSSKLNPRASLPRTRNGRRTEILRSDLCAIFSAISLMGWIPPNGRFPLKEAFHVLHHFPGRARQMHHPAQLAAIPHTVRKPAGELLHFSHAIRCLGVKNLPVVSRK